MDTKNKREYLLNLHWHIVVSEILQVLAYKRVLYRLGKDDIYTQLTQHCNNLSVILKCSREPLLKVIFST